MAKPVPHYGKFRIRWIEIDGSRKSETFDTEEEAEVALRRHELRVLEARRGGALVDPRLHTFRDLAD